MTPTKGSAKFRALLHQVAEFLSFFLSVGEMLLPNWQKMLFPNCQISTQTFGLVSTLIFHSSVHITPPAYTDEHTILYSHFYRKKPLKMFLFFCMFRAIILLWRSVLRSLCIQLRAKISNLWMVWATPKAKLHKSGTKSHYNTGVCIFDTLSAQSHENSGFISKGWTSIPWFLISAGGHADGLVCIHVKVLIDKRNQ